MHVCSINESLTWIILEIIMGSIDSGKRKILNNERETKAVFESKILLSSDRTYVANETRDTCGEGQRTCVKYHNRDNTDKTNNK